MMINEYKYFATIQKLLSELLVKWKINILTMTYTTMN
jgi:hypothetical protein